MAFDLIRRAGERLAQQPTPAHAIPAATASDGALISPPAEATPAADKPAAAPAEDEPVVALRQAMPRPHVAREPAQAARGSRRIAVDVARLRRAGMVITDGDSNHAIIEEFRLVKRPLLVKAFGPDRAGRNSRLIMVTSANAGEGKSHVAHNLALSIASEADTHVLLVDANLRSPSAPHRFGFAAEHGLTDLLTEEGMNVSDVLLRTDIGNLSILPAGKPHPRSTELLASPRMARLMAEMAQRYPDRVVILDAPPVLTSSETSVLAMHVGQILMVVEADRTNRVAIEESLALLECCPDISMVLNKGRKRPALESLGRV